MYAIEFMMIMLGLFSGLYGTSRFLLRPIARRLQLCRGYSDQFFVEMTLAVPIALFVIIGALLIVLAIE